MLWLFDVLRLYTTQHHKMQIFIQQYISYFIFQYYLSLGLSTIWRWLLAHTHIAVYSYVHTNLQAQKKAPPRKHHQQPQYGVVSSFHLKIWKKLSEIFTFPDSQFHFSFAFRYSCFFFISLQHWESALFDLASFFALLFEMLLYLWPFFSNERKRTHSGRLNHTRYFHSIENICIVMMA